MSTRTAEKKQSQGGAQAELRELRDQNERLRYQIKLLGAMVYARNPIAALVIERDWGEEHLRTAYRIFGDYASKTAGPKGVNWSRFEMDLCNDLGLRQQDIKSIVLAFFRHGEYVGLCRKYAMTKRSPAYREILAECKDA